MRASRVLPWLALAAFALTVLARLPARWLTPLLPAAVTCSDPAGTAWSGSCSSLEAHGMRADALRWSLRPARLLTGRAAAQLQLALPGANLEGEFSRQLFSGAIEARQLHGELALQPGGLLPGVPPDLGGRLGLAIDQIALRGRMITALRGVIEVRDLQQRSGEGPISLGSYRLNFAGAVDAAGNVSGTFADTGGPLAVEGSLVLTAAPGYLLNGTVAARADAPPALVRQIAFLGSPDAAGRRPFAQEATF